MFKIIGQFNYGGGYSNQYLVVDNIRGFSIQHEDALRSMLYQAKQVCIQNGNPDAEIEVASYIYSVTAPSKYKIPANPSIVRIPIDSCLTREGNLTLRGNEPICILQYYESDVFQYVHGVINNQDLGNIYYLRIACLPLRQYKEEDNNRDLWESVGWRICFYVPKLDFLTVLPIDGKGTVRFYSTKVPRDRDAPVYDIFSDLQLCMHDSKCVFKLAGKTSGKVNNEYITNNWLYGYTADNPDVYSMDGALFDMPDLLNSSLTIHRFLDVLERKGFIDIPILDIASQKLVSGKDLGHGRYFSYEERGGVGTCFKPSFISAWTRFWTEYSSDYGHAYTCKYIVKDDEAKGVEYSILQDDWGDCNGAFIIIEYHNKRKTAVYCIWADIDDSTLGFEKLDTNIKLHEDYRSRLPEYYTGEFHK